MPLALRVGAGYGAHTGIAAGRAELSYSDPIPLCLSAEPTWEPLHWFLTRYPQQWWPLTKVAIAGRTHARGEGSLAIPLALSAASRLQAEHRSSSVLWTGFSQHKYNICHAFSSLTSLLPPAALQVLYQVKVDGACFSPSLGPSVGLVHFCTTCQQSTCFFYLSVIVWERICFYFTSGQQACMS